MDRILNITIISVAEKWRGHGISNVKGLSLLLIASSYQILITHNLDSLRENGVNGVSAEAIAIASQRVNEEIIFKTTIVLSVIR